MTTTAPTGINVNRTAILDRGIQQAVREIGRGNPTSALVHVNSSWSWAATSGISSQTVAKHLRRWVPIQDLAHDFGKAMVAAVKS